MAAKRRQTDGRSGGDREYKAIKRGGARGDWRSVDERTESPGTTQTGTHTANTPEKTTTYGVGRRERERPTDFDRVGRE